MEQEELLLHDAVMKSLKAKLGVVAAKIPANARAVYVDYPVHFNVGDLLINLGTEQFFKDYRINIVERMSIGNLGRYDRESKTFNPGRRIEALDRHVREGAIILLHGGGNMGDIYPNYELSRQHIVSRYKNAKIIILPQSIHYGKPELRHKASDIYRQHPDLFIFVRDEPSLRFVQEESGLGGAIVPDMAHALWGVLETTTTQPVVPGSTLVQLRRDNERTSSPSSLTTEFDWDDMPTRFDRFAWKAFLLSQRFGRPGREFLPDYSLWYRVRDGLIGRSIKKFHQFDSIATDRLHGLILSSLLAKKVTYSDNTYGKLSRYAAQGLVDSPLVKRAPSEG